MAHPTDQPTALVIGGTGPTGPAIVHGLEARGHRVTVFHTGRHELDEVAHVEHIPGDPFSTEGLVNAPGHRPFQAVVACYRPLRQLPPGSAGRSAPLRSPSQA